MDIITKFDLLEWYYESIENMTVNNIFYGKNKIWKVIIKYGSDNSKTDVITLFDSEVCQIEAEYKNQYDSINMTTCKQLERKIRLD